MTRKHILATLVWGLVLALPMSAHATATASASASVDWSSLSLVFTPDDTSLAPGDHYLTWDTPSNYSASAVELLTFYYPDPLSDVYYDDWAGVDPALDASTAGNGWGDGNVSGDLGSANGEGHTIPAIGASGMVNVLAPDSFAGATAAATQGGYFGTSEAGWLDVSLDYSLSISLASTNDGLAIAQAYADFFVHNASDPFGDEDGDYAELFEYAFNETYDPALLTGTWTGRIYLGAGDEAHLEAYADVYLEADTVAAPPVPEPATLGLMAMGLVGLGVRRARRG